MGQQSTRRAAVAGTWYPGRAERLAPAVDGYLAEASASPARDIVAVIAPHAGLKYSGPVAAHAYRAVAGRRFDVAVLVGPSHYVGFDGVSIWPGGWFETPLGAVDVSAQHAAAVAAAAPVVHAYEAAHLREHSLEMQLPFLRRVLPDVPIVPLVMGYQERETILALADGLAAALAGARALLVASTDLSHYWPAPEAAVLDGRVLACIDRFDDEALLREFERYPEAERGRSVACGGGPAIAVMRAARALGAREGRILKYADSGDVSGDKSAVVGYVAGVFGAF